jgi:hypothetical protein
LDNLSSKFDIEEPIIFNNVMWKLLIFIFPFLLCACAGEVDKCVKTEMDKFYADKKSGRHISDIIYKEDGSVHKKKKRSPDEHEKLMRNGCLKKRFKKD